MYVPILAAKLYVPPPAPKAVRRPRLIERLNEGLRTGRKLTLISAPAGFGKTTLAGEWLAGFSPGAAWLSLDEGDGEPARFLTYLVAALRTVAPGIGEEALRVLQSPQPPAIEATLTALLNEIAAAAEGFVLVLDDYHVIDTKPIDQALIPMCVLKDNLEWYELLSNAEQSYLLERILVSHFCLIICRRGCTWSSPHVRIHNSPWLGYAGGAN